jgi:hypothetical protein
MNDCAEKKRVDCSTTQLHKEQCRRLLRTARRPCRHGRDTRWVVPAPPRIAWSRPFQVIKQTARPT